MQIPNEEVVQLTNEQKWQIQVSAANLRALHAQRDTVTSQAQLLGHLIPKAEADHQALMQSFMPPAPVANAEVTTLKKKA